MQNSVCLIGRLTRDIEIKTFDNGDRVTTFSLAVQRNYKNKQGEYDCDFIECRARNVTADTLFKYFKKGDYCPVTGELQTRRYEKDGINYTVTFVNVNSVTFVSDKKAAAVQPTTDAHPVTASESTDNGLNQDDFSFVPTSDDDDLPF